jgi:hypothetical protein
MLVLHFGDVRAHVSGDGTVGAFALHVQCPWRLDGPNGTVTGRDDLWEYAGPGERPLNWSPEDGSSLQDQKFANLFIRDESTRSWVNESDEFSVIAAQQASRGDVSLHLANGHEILLFPASCIHEAWRLFATDGERHVVFPDERRRRETRSSRQPIRCRRAPWRAYACTTIRSSRRYCSQTDERGGDRATWFTFRRHVDSTIAPASVSSRAALLQRA